MNEPLSPFEQEIRQTYHLPEANPAFFNRLEAQLQAQRPAHEAKARPTFHIARGWAYALATLIVTGVLILAIGPSKVLAQIQAVLGFVPGAGLVDTSSPFRQLAGAVSDTRDGVILTIQSAFLSADQTIISYTMSDLPAGMKRANLGDAECNAPAYLALPDNSKMEAAESGGGLAPDGAFVHDIRFNAPIPANFDRATLVFPCLEGTAKGKGPQDWQIGLAFKPVPGKVAVFPATLMPVQAQTASPATVTVEPPAQSQAGPAMPAMIVSGDRQEEMVLLSVVEQPDTYWLTWAYPDQFDTGIRVNGQRYATPFNPALYDANGVELPAPDHETQLELWKYEDSLRDQLSDQDGLKYSGTLRTFVVPKTGVAFPVYGKQDVYERSFPEKESFAEVEFDGSRVQTSAEPVEINREIQSGSVKFVLKAIAKDPQGGYSFLFDGAEGRVVQCQVELAGHPAGISGNGSFNPDDPFHFYQSLVYRQVPTGWLTVRISQPAVLGDRISFIGSWSPEK